MRVVRVVTQTVALGDGLVTIDAHAFGAFGVMVNVTATAALTRYTVANGQSSANGFTLMSGQGQDATLQFVNWGWFPLTLSSLQLRCTAAGPVRFDLVFFDEPPPYPVARFAVFQTTVALAASGSSVVAANFNMGPYRTLMGFMKSSRPAALVAQWGNSDDIITGGFTLATIAGATGGSQVFSSLQQHPWATYTLSNTDAVNANTITLIAYVDDAVR